ncbi:MAG TPA: hypothetical protein VH680_01985 [Gemmatimonadales bacterium]|jgi:hypothetical protein
MDPISLAAAALGAGLFTGLALVGVTVAGVDALRPTPGTGEAAAGARFYLLTAGTLGGLVLAGLVTWRILAPLESTYRRGGLAIVSAFATVPAMLVYPALHAAFGRAAMLATAALAAGAALLLSRRARHLAGS